MENTKINAIIIDDEEGARKSLFNLLHHFCPEVTVVDMLSNVPDGIKSIEKNKPQLVFLDIEMPEYNGFELLSSFQEIEFEIIFVTAYNDYALRAFEVSAIDYILKPIDVDQLKRAVKKVKSNVLFNTMAQRIELFKQNNQEGLVKKIAIPMREGLIFVDVLDIILIEADGSYSNIYLKNGTKILVSKKLKFFEDLLENRRFFYRPHRSNFINMNAIQKYIKGESLIVMDNGISLSISRDRKADFEKILKELRFSN